LNSKIARAIVETFREDEVPESASENHEKFDSITVHNKLALWDKNKHHTEPPDRVP
jgi:hypothetical protein